MPKGRTKPTRASARKPSKAAPKKAAPKKAERRGARPAARADVLHADVRTFAPLSEGERADAVRTLLDDERARAMAKIGRYRVVAAEPYAAKPPHALAGRRAARVVVYDYAADRCVEATVDIDRGSVAAFQTSTSQPLLSVAEEADAVDIAVLDPRVAQAVAAGAEPRSTFQYWSRRSADLAYRRRSAAVVFARAGRPTVVAVVDLIDRAVAAVVPADQW